MWVITALRPIGRRHNIKTFAPGGRPHLLSQFPQTPFEGRFVARVFGK